jgi:hypothetical protein
MFVADNQDHPQIIEILAELQLQKLSGLMHDERFVKIAKLPQSSFQK